MDLRTGPPADERRTRPRPLRGPILARPSPTCAHDNDRLRLPSASSPHPSETGKKGSTDPHLSQACPPCVTPSSASSCDHCNDARTVEYGYAARGLKKICQSSARRALFLWEVDAGITYCAGFINGLERSVRWHASGLYLPR